MDESGGVYRKITSSVVIVGMIHTVKITQEILQPLFKDPQGVFGIIVRELSVLRIRELAL